MAAKPVTVVINGEEHVSKAAADAEQAVEGFLGKSKRWYRGFADLKAAWDMVAGAVQQVWRVVMGAIDAYDAATTSSRKLESSAKLLGVTHEYLADIVRDARDAFGLSTTVANDYAVEVAKLAVNAGDASLATKLLASFLDLGAARGLTAQQSMDAVRQSILGIDEGTDKLFGKNPSGLWADFAKVIGVSAGKFTDQDKAAALAYYTLEAGLKVAGSWSTYLDSAAGRQEVLNQRMADAEIAFAGALQPLRLLTLELSAELLPVLGPLARWLGGFVVLAIANLVESFQTLRGVTGMVAAGIGHLTNNAALVKWGTESLSSALKLEAQMQALEESAKRTMDGIDSATRTSVARSKVEEGKRAELTKAMQAIETARVNAVRDGAKSTESAKRDEERAWREVLQSMQDTYKMLSELAVGTQEIARRLGPAFEKSLPTTHVDGFNAAMAGAKDAADKAFAAIFAGEKPSVGTFERIESKLRLANLSLIDMARGVLDGAQAFGGLDKESAAALASVLNVAGAFDKLSKAGLSFAGVTGVLGGVANIVSTMMQGDKERRELTRKNTEALNKLRTEGVPMSNKASGEAFAKATGALSAMDIEHLASLSRLKGAGFAGGELASMLAARGLRISDLDAIASDLGIAIRRSNGDIDFRQLTALMDALSQFGGGVARIGQSFGDQLGFFRDAQRLSGAEGMTQIADLLSFLGNVGGVSALQGLDTSDPVALRNALFSLFTGLNNNALSPAALGKLSATEFRSIIMDLIGLIDGLSQDGAPSVGDGLISAGGITMPGSVVEGTQQAAASSVATLLTESRDLQASIRDTLTASLAEHRLANEHLSAIREIVAGGIGSIDASLARTARMAALEAGTVPVLR